MSVEIVYEWLKDDFTHLVPSMASDLFKISDYSGVIYLINPNHKGEWPITAALHVEGPKIDLIFPDHLCIQCDYKKKTTFDLHDPTSLSSLGVVLKKWIRDTNLPKKTSK